MKIIMQRQYQAFRVVRVFAIIVLIVSSAIAQDSRPRISAALAGGEGKIDVALINGVGTITARSQIGGESRDSYIFDLEIGRNIMILLYSDQNKADFAISSNGQGCNDNLSFNDTTKTVRVKYLTKSKKVKYRKVIKWTGTVPETCEYRIDVTAYPGAADYTLQIKIK